MKEEPLTLLKEARELLAEMAGVEPWSHLHCDETSDGTHRVDDEWLERDARALVARIDALEETA